MKRPTKFKYKARASPSRKTKWEVLPSTSQLELNSTGGTWILALSEFDLKYESAKAVKGQVMADFVAQHCKPELAVVDLVPQTLFFDGSSFGNGSGIGVVLISPRGVKFEFLFSIEASATNNCGVPTRGHCIILHPECLQQGVQVRREREGSSQVSARGVD